MDLFLPNKYKKDQTNHTFCPFLFESHKVVARLRAVVLSLAGEGVMLWDTSIMHGFEASSKYSLQELLSPDCMRDVAHLTQQRLHVEEAN